VTTPDEDELWRSIVDNYGERAELTELTEQPGQVAEASLPVEPVAPLPVEEDERFVPPAPPPLPRPDNKRLVAWLGVFGVPTLLVLCLVLGLGLPSLVSVAMVVWFIGGFTYLVLQMPRGPRDPDDNGARL
jgi:hypothetical protein